MIVPYIFFIIGLLFIIKGGDYFVDSSIWIARVTRMPEVLIGATIVSLATTFPEIMVSIFSAVENQSSMAMGSAIGSIICNTGLILGLHNLIKPSSVKSRIFVVKGLLMISYISLLWLLARSGTIGFNSSLVLLFMLLVYIIYNVAVAYFNKTQNKEIHIQMTETRKEWVPQTAKFLFGIIFVIIGSNLLVNNGVIIAEFWGIPPAVISLTLIALGTSLPELVTAVTALLKGHAGISIGNILGANILNICMVLGISAQIRPIAISKQNLYFDIPTSLLMSLVLILPSIITKKISRIQSIILLAIYFIYIILIFYINKPI